jgi:hypothetical protein
MDEEEKSEVVIPTPEDFFLKTGLYDPIFYDIRDSNISLIRVIQEFTGTLDTFCLECLQSSTFQHFGGSAYQSVLTPGTYPGITSQSLPMKYLTPSFGTINWRFACSRDKQHVMEFWAQIYRQPQGDDANTYARILTKVGQYPSLADLQLDGVKKYSKLLKKQHVEFTKAIGLHAHGIGIGSMVYLRRIFEQLIEEFHQKALSFEDWDDEEYRRRRLNERIKLLNDRIPNALPSFLVENPNLYSVMSKHIHELTELECLRDFPTVRICIELILDERLAGLAKQQKMDEAKRQLDAAQARIKERTKS